MSENINMNSNIDNKINNCPKFAWIIMFLLGCLDLIRGFMHTVMLEHAAANIMGLNLSVARDDQLLLLGTFGISNFITGIFLIMISLKARNLVGSVYLMIPTSYFVGGFFIRQVAQSTSRLGGLPMMNTYIILCLCIGLYLLIIKVLKKRK